MRPLERLRMRSRPGLWRLSTSVAGRCSRRRRLKQLFGRRWTRGALVRLHTAEKMLLLAHHRPGYEELGRLVASLKGIDAITGATISSKAVVRIINQGNERWLKRLPANPPPEAKDGSR